PRDNFRQALELFPAHRRLNIGHPIVESERWIRLEDHLFRSMPLRIGYAHRVLAQQAEATVPIGIARRDHASVTRADHLSRVKGKAGRVRVRRPDLLPSAAP